MTKKQLIEALAPFEDDIELLSFNAEMGSDVAIEKACYYNGAVILGTAFDIMGGSVLWEEP